LKKLLPLCLMILSMSGCSVFLQTNPESPAPSFSPPAASASPATEAPSASPQESFVPEIGGISLGDPADEVLEAFGTDYDESVFDESLSLGEPFRRLTYDNGVIVVIGKDSQQVLEIESTSADVSNNLGYQIGDSAQAALQAFRDKYAEPKSNQDDSILNGWFLVRGQELVIFNYDQTDTLVNPDVNVNSKITRIKLSNFDYMD